MAHNKESVSWYSSAVSRSETTIQSPMDTPATARIHRTERGNPRPTYNQHEKHTEAFVQVIIDSDCLHFENEWITGGWFTGWQVVEEIQMDVREYLNRNGFETQGLRILVYAYANVSKLAEWYVRQGFGSAPIFMGFCRGFNSHSGEGCYFQDIGSHGLHWPGEVFLRALSSHACKRIISANPTISQYRCMTETYLALLEKPQRAGVVDKLLDLDFAPGIFKTASGWNPSRQILMESPPYPVPNDSLHQSFDRIFQNRFIQRIDPFLEVSDALKTAVRVGNLCNEFGLRGHCRWSNGHRYPCRFQHRLISEQELTVLRVLTRQTPCKNGTGCRDSNCLYGHNCTKDFRCVRRTCKFPPAMHLLSKEIVDTPLTGLSSISQSAEKLLPFRTDPDSKHHDGI